MAHIAGVARLPHAQGRDCMQIPEDRTGPRVLIRHERVMCPSCASG
jgi:hypothetical protein